MNTPQSSEITSKSPQGQEFDLYEQVICDALENFADAEWLGKHSPLAQPYLLGRMLNQQVLDALPQSRGQLLQTRLRQSAEKLQKQIGRSNSDLQELLRIAYFERLATRKNRDIAFELHISEKSFYRYRTDVIRELSKIVNRDINPAIHSESLQIVGNIIKRENLISEMGVKLANGESIYVLGTGGVGKTTLASVVASQWRETPHQPIQNQVHWHTFRPRLNDDFSSVAFNLAHFLRQNNCSTTWLQLVASARKVNPTVILGLLRHDIAQLSCKPLFCFDETDLLKYEHQPHSEVIELLEELQKIAPVLLIGQQPIIDCGSQYWLQGFDNSQVSLMLSEHQVTLSNNVRDKIQQTTRGNPGLIKLLIGLHRSGEDIEGLVSHTKHFIAANALFSRIWRRLSEDERLCLIHVALADKGIQIEANPKSKIAIEELARRELLVRDKEGFAHAANYIRDLAIGQASDEVKIALHLTLAQEYESHGIYTLALGHYIRGKQISYAMWLWALHDDTEIELGRSAQALNSLMLIQLSDLSNEREQIQLKLAIAKLLLISSRASEAEEHLTTQPLTLNAEEGSLTSHFMGMALEAQDRCEAAVTHYKKAANLRTSSNEYRLTQLHADLSYLYTWRLNEIKDARQEALLARLIANSYHGATEEYAGNLELAASLHEEALEIADQIVGCLKEKAFVYSHAGNVAWKQNKLDRAIHLLKLAIQCEETRGDFYRPIFNRVNLCAAYIASGHYYDATIEAEKGLEIALQLKHAHLVAGLASNGSEAYYFLGDLDHAEQLVFLSLQQEDGYWRSYALTVLAQIRRKQTKYSESIEYLKDAIQTALDVNDPYAEAAAHRQLAETYRAANQPQQAQDSYAAALALYQKMGLQKEINEITQTLATLAAPNTNEPPTAPPP